MKSKKWIGSLTRRMRKRLLLMLCAALMSITGAWAQIKVEGEYRLTADNCNEWTLGGTTQWQTDEDGSFGFGGTPSSEVTHYSPKFDLSGLTTPWIEVTLYNCMMYAIDSEGKTVKSYGGFRETFVYNEVLDKSVVRLRIETYKGYTHSLRNLKIRERPVINTFPYTLEKEADGWILHAGRWCESDTLVKNAYGNLSLESPLIKISGNEGILDLEIADRYSSSYVSINGEDKDGTNVFSSTLSITKDRKHYYVTFPKEVVNLNISNSYGNPLIYSLTLNSTETLIEWHEADGIYTVQGGEYATGQTGYFQLPDIERATKVTMSFDVEATSWDNMELYLTDNGTNYQVITPQNGRVELELSFSASRFIPGFRVMSTGGQMGTVTIRNYRVNRLQSGSAMQFDLSYWYDFENSGQMGFSYYLNGHEYNHGFFRIEHGLPVKYKDFPDPAGNMKPYSVNNDEAVDFISDSGNNCNVYVYNEDGTEKMEQIPLKFGEFSEDFLVCDYNSDGRADILIADANKVAVQKADGSFLLKDYTTYTQEEYNNRDKDNDEWVKTYPSSGIVSSTFGDAFLSGSDMFIGSGSYYEGALGGEGTTSIDFNRDGLPDIIDSNSGNVLLNVGEDRFVTLPMGGAVFFRDLNSDQIQDYIVYDSSTKTVTACILASDGTMTSQELISNLSMDKQIWCYDLDKDGDVDILLPFSYQESNMASFLVVFENDGRGHFKMHEAAFDKMIGFKACADIDGDGYYEVLATYSKDDKTSEYHDILLLEADGKYIYSLNLQPIMRLEKRLYNSRGLDIEIGIADIDGDGYYDLLTEFGVSYGNGKYNFTTTQVYSLKESTVATRANSAPAQMGKPTFFYEAENGLLKVSWAEGKDDESSSIDLTYALRIGSEPGKGDICYAHATSDGRRLNLIDGNMGHGMERLFDVSGWPAGKYYIAVQAIDPMHHGSAWSEEAVFEKSNLSSDFILSSEHTTADTLTVALSSPRDASLTYDWDFDGARVISESTDGITLGIMYDTPGKKRITLKVTDAGGNVSTSDRQIFIAGAKLAHKDVHYSSLLSEMVYVTNVVDLDNDGQPELLTSKGVYENDGEGGFKKLAKIYNTQLTFRPEYYKGLFIGDVNKDGQADVILPIVTFNAKADAIHHYINDGEKTLRLVSHEGYSVREEIYKLVDFNNDGFVDSESYLNTGNDLDFASIEHGLYSNDSPFFYADVDRDGFYDIVQNYCPEGTQAMSYARGNGDGTFTQHSIPITAEGFTPEGAFTISRMADMNNDGYLDIVMKMNESNIAVLLNNRNEAFDRMVKLTMPAGVYMANILQCADVDNNGQIDIILHHKDGYENEDKIMFLYDNWRYELANIQVEWGVDYDDEFADMDGDGVPDIIGNQDTYYHKNYAPATNSRPEAPKNIRFAQDEQYAVLKWDAAKDAETPASQMRYNVSVKRQGASGEGAFVISPMNDMKADAAIIPQYRYPMATTYPIPLSVLPEGTYEVQIQAIDAWGETSEFSEVFLTNVEAMPQIGVPTDVHAGATAAVRYTGNGPLSALTWDWDGGRLDSQDGETYYIVWDTEGRKQVSVSYEGSTATAEVLVKPAIDASFSINSEAFTGAETLITMPDCEADLTWTASKDGGAFRPVAQLGISINYSGGADAHALFSQAGSYVLMLTAESGNVVSTAKRSIEVTDALSMLNMGCVAVDAQTGKYCISWTYTGTLPSLATHINIYKEGTNYGDFRLAATVPVSQMSWIDADSDPQAHASRYCLSVVGADGTESLRTAPHKTVHVMLNRGAGSSWNVVWNSYEGLDVTTYRILRGTDADNLTVIAEVAGSLTSYTDKTAPAGVCCYALDFDTTGKNEAKSHSTRSASEVRTNIVSSESATDIILADDITVLNMGENTAVAKGGILLSAEIYPLNATYRRVDWTIVEGTDFARVDQNGVVYPLSDKVEGPVTVRATTIDGSGLYNEIVIPAEELVITAVDEAADGWQDGMNVYQRGKTLFVGNIHNGSLLVLYNAGGQVVHAEKATETSAQIQCETFPAGIYILKAVSDSWQETRKIVVK